MIKLNLRIASSMGGGNGTDFVILVLFPFYMLKPFEVFP